MAIDVTTRTAAFTPEEDEIRYALDIIARSPIRRMDAWRAVNVLVREAPDVFHVLAQHLTTGGADIVSNLTHAASEVLQELLKKKATHNAAILLGMWLAIRAATHNMDDYASMTATAEAIVLQVLPQDDEDDETAEKISASMRSNLTNAALKLLPWLEAFGGATPEQIVRWISQRFWLLRQAIPLCNVALRMYDAGQIDADKLTEIASFAADILDRACAGELKSYEGKALLVQRKQQLLNNDEPLAVRRAVAATLRVGPYTVRVVVENNNPNDKPHDVIVPPYYENADLRARLREAGLADIIQDALQAILESQTLEVSA